MEYLEYKFIETLPEGYVHIGKPNFPVVIAVQEKLEKKECQIGLFDLVIFFKNKRLIKEQTATEILELNDIRNTFHFNKPRTKKCNLELVESALKLLVHTIENAPTSLRAIRNFYKK